MIVRGPRPEHSWTVLTNSTLRDHRISFRARGLLAYLLSMPDDWRTSTVRLAQVTTEGRDAVRSAMRELEEAGYVRRVRRQDSRGRWQTLNVVYDEPGSANRRAVDNLCTDPVDNSSTDAGIPVVGKLGRNRKTPTKDLERTSLHNSDRAS